MPPFSWLSSRVIHAIIFLGVLGLNSFSTNATGEEVEADPPLVHVHTEYMPYMSPNRKQQYFVLTRELARQGLIKTIREEFHLPVIDETLGESVVEAKRTIHLVLVERHEMKKTGWQMRLILLDEKDIDGNGKILKPKKLWKGDRVWEKTFSHRMVDLHLPLAAGRMNEDWREDLRAALTKAGLKPASPPAEAPIEVSDGTRQKLLQVDFGSQFDIVKQAHQAIDSGAPAKPWKELLARAYANLSLLTNHHWNSASEAFAARAFLYAEDLVADPDATDHERWVHAYTYAMAGVHFIAIRDYTEELAHQKKERAEKEDQKSDDATEDESDAVADAVQQLDDASETQEPEWAGFVRALCECDRKALKRFGEQHPDWKAWTTRMHFWITSTYGDHQWMLNELDDVQAECPYAYGVYANLVSPRSPLGVSRTGAWEGLAALRKGTEETFAAMPDLPVNVEAGLEEYRESTSQYEPNGFDRFPTEQFPRLPAILADQLRLASTPDSATGASWSAIAFLLEEELFVKTVHFLQVSANAVEHSFDDFVREARPLLGNHRYWKLIESFQYRRRSDREFFLKCFEDFPIQDPNRKMNALIKTTLNVPSPQKNKSLGNYIYVRCHYDWTIYSLLTLFLHDHPRGSDWIRLSWHSMFPTGAFWVQHVSPNLEVGNRMQIDVIKKPSRDDLLALEAKVRDDLYSYVHLAERYAKRKRTDDAIRVLEKSMEIKRTYDAARQLADIYWQKGETDNWRQTYLQYLEETEPLGLDHTRINNFIAWEYMRRGEWELAGPHAEAAGQSYSNWGLYTAARASESLAQWERSERMFRAMSESYPSSSGYNWFLWCCRTGRGDRETARQLAEKILLSSGPARSRDQWVLVGQYQLLNYNKEEALEAYQKAFDLTYSGTCAFMVAKLARELGRDELADQVWEPLLKDLDEKDARLARRDAGEKEPEANEADRVRGPFARALAACIRNGEMTPANLENLETLLAKNDSVGISGYCYFIAEELARHGQVEQAEKYWRRSMVLPDRDRGYASLSGQRLAQIHGVSRPDDDRLTPADLWPPITEEGDSEERNSETSAAGDSSEEDSSDVGK